MKRVIAWWLSFLADDEGQDLVEYALLCGTVGFAGVAGVTLLQQAMGGTYADWLDAAQSDELVNMPDPE